MNYTDEHAQHHNQILTFTWIKEVDIAMAGLDIIALTSLNEGTPVSLIEASASGKPIVTTKCWWDKKDVVKSDENAYIVENGCGWLCSQT
ncbi:MAG: glycosyltransferase [Chitinophagales bacterium]